jgi:hypothetical protein
MSSQLSFSKALLDPGAPTPTGLRTWNGSDPAGRFAVYRNNVLASLIDALADTFAFVQELVGEDFFRAMGKEFVLSNPPRSRLMAYYGAGFADFVEDFFPARSIPFLADMARLEMARVMAYHAAESDPIEPLRLQAAIGDPQQLLSLCLSLHPCVQVICSPYAVCALWAAHQGTLDLATVDPYLAESALVYRQGLNVEMLQITGAQGRFVEGLQRGKTLSEAAQHAHTDDPNFDFPGTLAWLIRQQLLSDITYADPACPQSPRP